jgi:predicted RNase H-like HicB family nuclease
MRSYIALIRKDSDSDFGVEFPDFPGCVTAGTSLDEALAMAREALALHIEGLIEDGTLLPAPATLDRIMEVADNQDAVPALVPAPTAKGRAVRINITMDESLLARIDETVGPGERSAFLARAATVALQSDVMERYGNARKTRRRTARKSKVKTKKKVKPARKKKAAAKKTKPRDRRVRRG